MSFEHIGKALFLTVFGFCAVSAMVSATQYFRKSGGSNANIGYDLQARRYEIMAAHDGINSFDIFERRIHSQKYRGLSRPDMPEEPEDNRFVVHAYPPWHTAFCWWYPLFSERSLGLLFIAGSIISGLIALIWMFLKADSCSDFYMLCCLVAVFLAQSTASLFCAHNYGLLLLAVSILFYNALEHKQYIVAGFALALLMVKPQIGILFALPLLWSVSGWVVLVIGGMTCLLATIIVSLKVHIPVFELIMEIPQIGAPYGTAGVLAKYLFGTYACKIGCYWSAIMLIAAGVASYFARNSDGWIKRCTPAIAFLPIWTYSNPYDHVIMLPCVLCVISLFRRGGKVIAIALISVEMIAAIVKRSCSFGVAYINATSIANVCRMITYVLFIVCAIKWACGKSQITTDNKQ